MICAPVRSATSRITVMSRPRLMGVRSTIVRTPRSIAARSSFVACATMASRSIQSGNAWRIAGVATITCSCMSVKPRLAVSIGPRTPFTVAMRELSHGRGLVAQAPPGRYDGTVRWLVCALVLAGAPAAAAERGRPLRVVSLNLYHGGVTSVRWGDGDLLERRLAMVVEQLRQIGPDVIGVQEASTGRDRGNVVA